MFGLCSFWVCSSRNFICFLVEVFGNDFCGDIVCYRGKDLDLKTNQPGLKSGFHHLLLDDLGQIIQSSWASVSLVRTFVVTS